MHQQLFVPGVLEIVPLYDRAIAQALPPGERKGLAEVRFADLPGYPLREVCVTDWKNTYTFVAIEDLSLDERRRFMPALAETWAALAAPTYRGGEGERPRLARLLAQARLMLVDSSSRRHPVGIDIAFDGPYRFVEIGFQRVADDYFQVGVSRGRERLASLGGAMHAVLAALDSARGAPEERQYDVDRERVIDRIVRAASGGLATRSQIGLAFALHDLDDPDAWEESLGMSEGDPARAGEILTAIQSAGDAATIELFGYGTARRITLSADVLRASDDADELEAHVDVGGARELALPAEDVWIVSGVDDAFVMRSPPVRAPRPSPQPAPLFRPSVLAYVAAVAVVLALFALRLAC